MWYSTSALLEKVCLCSVAVLLLVHDLGTSAGLGFSLYIVGFSEGGAEGGAGVGFFKTMNNKIFKY